MDVPPEQQRAAEIVRRHLVALRGGAPFLSPTDSALLVTWLDAAVPVHRILHGLDRASAQRRARRTRAPLALTHARRFVKVSGGRRGPEGPGASAVPASPPPLAAESPVGPSSAPHPLAPLIAQLEGHLPRTPAPRATSALLVAWRALPPDDPDALADEALAAVGAWHAAAWDELDEAVRDAYIARAHDVLDDLADAVDEGRFAALVEEHARGRLRDDHPGLSATDVLRQVFP